jgi:two-component system sensor histidine kinase DegS
MLDKTPDGTEAFARIWSEATGDVAGEARRLHELADQYRAEYRNRLESWMQLRARFDQRRGNASDGGLRAEHESLGRELAAAQARLKRLETAAHQLDVVARYLATEDPLLLEPSLETDASPATMRLRIVQAQEAERQRLAEEIHDGPAQVLTNAIFRTEYVDRMIDDSPRAARAELAFLRSMLRDGLDEVRGTIASLRPPVVETGLSQALADQAAEFESRHGIGVQVDVNGIDARLAPTARASVLRIVQEALQNVRKHAAARQVTIGLDGDQLVISDNGRGFDVMRLATATRNFGLQFMRERAELMGAELRVESRQGEGTRILLRLPEPSRAIRTP